MGHIGSLIDLLNFKFPLMIHSHDDLCQKLAVLLTFTVKTLFPNIDVEFVGSRPNGTPEYSDLYCIFMNTNQKNIKCLADVKRAKQVDFNSDDILKQ